MHVFPGVILKCRLFNKWPPGGRRRAVRVVSDSVVTLPEGGDVSLVEFALALVGKELAHALLGVLDVEQAAFLHDRA